MATNNREQFDYDRYAREVLGATDEQIGDGFNQEQKDFIYESAVKKIHEANVKQTKGRGKALNAAKRTLDMFDDARGIIGVPEEIQDTNEPYSTTKLNDFLSTIHPSNRDMPVTDFLDRYADQFYDGDFSQLERPFLNDLSKTQFKKRVVDKLSDSISFDGSVDDAITQLEEAKVQEQQLAQARESAERAVDQLNTTFEGVIERSNQRREAGEPDEPTNETPSLLRPGGLLGGAVSLAAQAGEQLAAEVTGNDEVVGTFAESVESFDNFTNTMAKSLYNSAIPDTAAGGLRLLDAALEDPTKDVYFDRETQQFYEVGMLGGKQVIQEAEEKGTLVKWADAIQENLKLDVQPESFSDEIAVAAGQLLSLFLGGAGGRMVSGKLGTSEKVSEFGVGGAMGIAQGAESGYDDYVASIQERNGEFDADTAQAAVAFNGLIGASEMLPVLKAFELITPDKKVPVGTLLERIDNATGNVVSGAFEKVASSKAGRRVADAAEVAGEAGSGALAEASQEIFATMASDMVARDILEYDPTRGFVTDDVVKSGEIGGILGGVMNALFSAMGISQRRRLNEVLTTQEGDPPQQPVADGEQPVEQTPQPVAPEIRTTSSGTVVATSGLSAGVGKSESEALADLEAKERSLKNPIKSISDDFEIEVENLDDGSQRSVVRSGDGEVVFVGENSESMLNQLIDETDPNNIETDLPNGLQIQQQPNGKFELTVGDTKVISNDVRVGLGQLNNKLIKRVFDENALSVREEQLPELVTLPVNEGGFIVEDVERVLEDRGFIPVHLPEAKGKQNTSPVQTKSVSAYRDGLIYTVKIKGAVNRSTKQDAIAEVSIQDLDGFSYSPNTNEKGQQYLARGVLQPPVSDAAYGRTIRGEGEGVSTGGIVLRAPNKGVRIRQDVVAGEQQTVIDAQSVDEVAQRIGGRVVFADSDGAVIEKNGVATTFALTEDGKLAATINGQGHVFDGPFSLSNTARPDELSLSVVTRELQDLDYEVTAVDVDSVTLTNGQGDVVTLTRGKQRDAIEAKINDVLSLWTGMADFRKSFDLPEPVDIRDEDVDLSSDTEDQDVGEPVTERPEHDDPNERRAETLGKLFDFTSDKERIRVMDGKAKIDNSGTENPDIVFEVDPDDVDVVLDQMRGNGEIRPTSYDIETEDGNFDWTIEDINQYLELLPPHISKIIRIHTAKKNPASENGALGYFMLSDDNGAPAIHIDASPGRSLHSVLSTISEEVAHFSFDSWGNRNLDELYDRMWDLVKDDVIRDLPHYIEPLRVNINNPAPQHKWVLVNEYFSKQGTSFIDFKDQKVSAPPGVSRERIEELKRLVSDRVDEFFIDLTKDTNFKKGDPDATQFMENILRMQAGAVVGRGVKFRYVQNQPGDTRATIEVHTTPYGSQRVTQYDGGSEAAHVSAVIKELAGRSGLGKDFYSWMLRNGPNALVNKAHGRKTAVLIDGIYRGASTAEASMLKAVKLQSYKVNLRLASVGFDGKPIDGSYLKTFREVGLTKKRDLKLATEMDQFIRKSYTKGNNNVATIRQLYREMQDVLFEIVRKHPAARGNIDGWVDQIDSQLKRFSTEWSHIAYEVHQPGGDKDLIAMREALDPLGDHEKTSLTSSLFNVGRRTIHGKSLQERARKAKKQKARLENQIKLGKTTPNKSGPKIVQLNRIINLETRLDALERWAQKEYGSEGQTVVRSAMVSKINELLAENHNYNIPGANLSSDFISATRARKLDENNEHHRNLMTFLGRIDDPLEVAISNMEQQNKVINNLSQTMQLAEHAVNIGIARPRGSRETIGSEELNWDTQLFAGENAGVLEFLEFNPEISPFIKDDIEISKAVERTAMDSWMKFLRATKGAQTVLNAKVLVSNYISNITTTAYTGHIAYLWHHRKEVGEGIKQAWIEQSTFGSDEFDGTTGEMIAKEMVEHGVLQTSVGSLDAAINKGSSSVELVLGAATEILSMSNTISADRKALVDGTVRRMMDSLRKAYGFGDDMFKILPYVINRHIGVLKAKETISRSDFDDTPRGETQYNNAVTKAAIDIAVDRTLRETITWNIAPQWARRLSGMPTFIMNDYVMHPIQMVRIGIENSRMLVEDQVELRRAKRDGDSQEYIDALTKRVATRGVGLTLQFVDTVGHRVLGYGALGYAVMNAVAMFSDDEDDDVSISERKSMNWAETQAALKITNASRSHWGGTPLYPVHRDGYKVTYVDGKRLSAMAAIMPSQQPTDQPQGFGGYAVDFFESFANFNEETLMSEIIRTASTKFDEKGNELTPTERVTKLLGMPIPGMFRQGSELLTSTAAMFSDPDGEAGIEPHEELRDSLFAIGGVKTVTLDLRDELSKIGYGIKNQTHPKYNTSLANMNEVLLSGDELSDAQIKDVVQSVMDSNNQFMGYVDYSIKAYKEFGFDDKTMVKHLRTNTSGVKGPKVAEDLAGDLVAGRNGLHRKIIKQLEGKLKTAKKERVGPSIGAQTKQNRIDALTKAAKMYQDWLSKNPTGRPNPAESQ